MRLLLINPNTTAAITDKMAAAARAALPGVAVTAATGRFGAAYIASRASFCVAGHAALDALAAHGAGQDAVLLACFGDPGLDALREVSPVPVVSLIEASCAEAGAGGRRFSIVTGGARWAPMLKEQAAAHGFGAELASIRTVAPSGGQIAADPQGAHAILAEACRTCVVEDGAEAVILGGAGLIGIRAAIERQVPAALVCSVEAGLRAAGAALARGRREASTDAVASVGLGEALAGMFARGGM